MSANAQKRIRKRAAERRREHHREKVRKAETEVLAYLEKRWSDHLEGGRMPNAMRQRIRRHTAFRALVQQRLEGKPFVHDDRDHAPDVERAHDGSISNRLLEELGDEPDRYVCPRCGEEQDAPVDDECDACRAFFQKTE
ncbi:MAG: hypothetical protein ACODAG_06140 [Myxococcota bacterium]